MCPIQNSYAAIHAAAFVGQRADFGLFDIQSKAAEVDVPFGLAIVRGSADDTCKLPTVAGQAFLGISEYTTAWAADSSDVHFYEKYREVNIVDFGRVHAICEDGCVPGDPVFFRHTTGTGTLIGSFRTDADTATADQIAGATWETTAAAGGLAIIQLRSEAPSVAPMTLSETITAAGASVISLLTQVSLFDTTLGAQTGTLADGFEGQEKTLKMTVDGATDMVVTPANLHDGATLTFADVNDSCVLRFIGATWMVISNNGVALA